MLANYEAVIFDFDGVIVESQAIKIKAFEALYAEHGADVVRAAVAHHLAHGGISRRQKIRHCHKAFLGVQLDEAGVNALSERFSELVEDAVCAADAVPGSKELLETYAGRRPLFVVSGTPHHELGRIVRRRNLAGYFTEVFGSPPEKPPIIREILDRYGLRAEHVAFVGDAMTDYHAAAETRLDFFGRVPPGEDNPFPKGTTIVPDMTPFLPAS